MGTVGTFVDQFLGVTLRAPAGRRGRGRRRQTDPRGAGRAAPVAAEQVKLAIENLPPPPPPSEYPLRVIVEQEEGAENEITGKVEEPEEEPAPDPPAGVEATDRSGPSSKSALFQQLTEKGIDEETAPGAREGEGRGPARARGETHRASAPEKGRGTTVARQRGSRSARRPPTRTETGAGGTTSAARRDLDRRWTETSPP